MRCAVLILAICSGLPIEAETQSNQYSNLLASATLAWSQRSNGHHDGLATGEASLAPIAAFERLIEHSPDNLESHWKLMRALYFRGDYALSERGEQKVVFARATVIFEDALGLIGNTVGIGGSELARRESSEILSILGDAPQLAPVFFWGAVSWGAWGRSTGVISAARQGVAGRLRRYAEVTIGLDPRCESAGGYRFFGRMHTEAPRIPFVTGWIDRATGIDLLRRAVELAPREPTNKLFLADALIDFRRSELIEATRLLEELANLEPRAGHVLEDWRARRDARALLRSVRR